MGRQYNYSKVGPKKADALTSEEEDLLWDTVLGKINPISLNYTNFFPNQPAF